MTVRNALVAAAFAVVTLSGSAAIAQEARFELRDGDTVKAVLERQVGKRVTLVLPSSPEITGVVTRVVSANGKPVCEFEIHDYLKTH